MKVYRLDVGGALSRDGTSAACNTSLAHALNRMRHITPTIVGRI